MRRVRQCGNSLIRQTLFFERCGYVSLYAILTDVLQSAAAGVAFAAVIAMQLAGLTCPGHAHQRAFTLPAEQLPSQNLISCIPPAGLWRARRVTPAGILLFGDCNLHGVKFLPCNDRRDPVRDPNILIGINTHIALI